MIRLCWGKISTIPKRSHMGAHLRGLSLLALNPTSRKSILLLIIVRVWRYGGSCLAVCRVKSYCESNRIESMEIECTVSSSRMDAIDTKSVLWVCVCFVALWLCLKQMANCWRLCYGLGILVLPMVKYKSTCSLVPTRCVEGQKTTAGNPAKNGTSCPLTLLEI